MVVNGASLVCSFGTASSTLMVMPDKKVMSSAPVANIMDMVPMKNILPFAMCTSMANPAVSAATTLALGILTPQPCTPVIAGPWVPGAVKVVVGGSPALHNACTLTCSYGGVISILNAGQTKTLVN